MRTASQTLVAAALLSGLSACVGSAFSSSGETGDAAPETAPGDGAEAFDTAASDASETGVGTDAAEAGLDGGPGIDSGAPTEAGVDVGTGVDAAEAASPTILGNGTSTGQYIGLSDGLIYDNAIDISQQVTLLSFHMDVQGTSGTVALGLWSTTNGAPSALVAASPPLGFVNGEVSWPVSPPVTLPAGRYWLGFEKWDTGNGALSQIENDPIPPETTCDATWAGTSLPLTFPSCTAVANSPGQAILWVVVQP